MLIWSATRDLISSHDLVVHQGAWPQVREHANVRTLFKGREIAQVLSNILILTVLLVNK